MTRLYLSIAAALLIAVLAAGCGGDDETTTSTTSSSPTTGTSGASGASGAEGSSTVAAVNAVCKSVDKDIEAAFSEVFGGEEPSGPPDAVESQKITDTLTPVIDDALDQIEAVPGAEDDPGITSFVDAAQSDLDELNSDPEAAFEGGGDPFTAANDAASEAGLDECAD